MSAEEVPVVERLRDLGIAFERHEHPPVATVEQAAEHWAGIDAAHCKNLFLRNQKGDRHYLLILEHSKKADLRAVANQIGDGKLSFGSPERLLKHLGLTPGSVSPFGLIHDSTIACAWSSIAICRAPRAFRFTRTSTPPRWWCRRTISRGSSRRAGIRCNTSSR
jgi:hypothetical protein